MDNYKGKIGKTVGAIQRYHLKEFTMLDELEINRQDWKLWERINLVGVGVGSVRFDFGINFWFQIGSDSKIKKNCSVFMKIKSEPKPIGRFKFGFGSQFRIGFGSLNNLI